MTNRLIQTMILLSAVSLATPARAADWSVQRPGAGEVWPGKFMIGFHPLGFQVTLDGVSTGGYKLDLDLAYRVKEWSKVSLWVGGEFSYTYPLYSCPANNGFPGDLAGCAHDIGLLLLVRLTFEQLVTRLPLVPYVDFALGADILLYPARFNSSGVNTGAGIPLRVGAGAYYWIVKHVGLGAESHFSFGPGVYPTVGNEVIANGCGGNSTCTQFFGYWDFLIGARAVF
jgi:hypothetical protein